MAMAKGSPCVVPSEEVISPSLHLIGALYVFKRILYKGGQIDLKGCLPIDGIESVGCIYQQGPLYIFVGKDMTYCMDGSPSWPAHT